MIYLTVEEIILLHEKIIKSSGGTYELRDRGLLESAVNGVLASFDNIELYPTIEEKAARYAYALTNNHAFVDGNKRIGILVMIITLKLNDMSLQYSQKELINLGLNIANGKLKYNDIYKWIIEHKK